MSHEIIYDKSYFKGNKDLKSFDLTDSLISGICSKSSRPEDSDKSCANTSSSVSSTSKTSTISSTESCPKSESSSTSSTKSSTQSSTSTINQSGQSCTTEYLSYDPCSNNESSTTSSTTLCPTSESTTSSNTLCPTSESSTTSSNNSCPTSESSTTSSNNSCPTSESSTTSSNTSSTTLCPTSESSKSTSKSISKSSNHKPKHHTANILPARADPFVSDRKDKIIRYNFERCISSGAVLVLGGNDGMMTFDPANGNIVTGKNNKLHNSTNSSIIGSSGVKLKNAKHTIVLGVKATDGDEFPEDLDQTLLIRNLHVAGNLRATNIIQNSVYIEGNTQHDVYHQITKEDGVDIIYVNPINGIIWIQLGSQNDSSFESNRTLVIKDVSLQTGKTSTNNVHIVVPKANNGVAQTKIEYYNEKGNLVVSSDNKLGGYILNTAGGSVTYRYVDAFIPGQSATWMIQNQFLGNLRSCPFPETTNEVRSKLIKKY